MAQLYEFNLRDYWNIFLKRRKAVVLSFLSVFLTVFVYINLQTPMYRATVIIKIDPYLGVPSDIVFPAGLQYLSGAGANLSDYAKQVVSGPVLEEAAKELGVIKDNMPDNEKNSIVGAIGGSALADEIPNTNLIRLRVQSEDPVKAAALANKIAVVFKKINIEQKNQRAYNVRIFIENTLSDVSKKLKEQDERLRALTMQGAIGTGVNLVSQIYELEQKKMSLLAKFTEKYPDVIRTDEQISELKDQLRKLPKEEFEYGILKRDIAIDENLYTTLKQKLPEAQIKEAERVDNVLIINPAIPPKMPFYPDKKKSYTVGFVLGLVLSVTMALVIEHIDTSIGRVDDIENFIKVNVIGVIPFYSKKITEEIKKKKGWLEKLFRKKPAKKERMSVTPVSVLEEAGSSVFLEAFRILSVNLQVLFGKGGKIKNKVLLITSCNPEEGKTMTTSNISVILAQMGYKTLIIDCDTRRANVHKMFGLPHKEDGLLDVLTGKITFDHAVKTATDIMLGSAGGDKVIDKPWMNNLNIITAGSTFPNPINLFNSEKMNELLATAKERYDVVLLDSSPILAVSEPSILIPKADGVLLVYKAGATSRLALRRAKMQIESVKGPGALSGVILNNVTPEIGMDTYYYYYRRYYGEKEKPQGPKKIEG